MKDMVTESIPLIASSPNGIKKLRDLILMLAVTGKLVPQDANDEPASGLIRAMVKAKKELLAEGKIRREREEERSSGDKSAMKLPSSWEPARVGDILTVIRGASPRPKGDPRFFSTTRTPFHWVKISDLRKHGRNGVLTDTDEFLTEQGSQHSVLVPTGTLVITNSATIGVPILMGIDGYIHDGFLAFPFFPQEYLDQSYFLVVLKALTPHLMSEARGLAQLNMNSGIMRNAIAAIAPLAEQRRIVAKVDELMALCDLLESEQHNAEAAHAKLVKELLSSLTNFGADKNLVDHWARINHNFNVLFTTEESTVLLKKVLVQLGTMGRLGTHEESDEPATLVIKAISDRKRKLTESGRIAKGKPLAKITETEMPFKLPIGWTWARIGDVAIKTEYGISEKTFEMTDGVPVLKMGDIQDGRVILGGQKKTYNDLVPNELWLKPGDLLYNRTNSAELVGKTGLFEGPANVYTFASYLIRIEVPDDLVLPQYLNLAMNAPSFRETQINPFVKQQCGQANVNGTVMRSMLVPIPPKNEQQRIVEKIHRLIAVCDQLGKRLRDLSSFGQTLAEVLISACFEPPNEEDRGLESVGKDASLGVVCI